MGKPSGVTIKALIARIAELSLAVAGRIGLEVGAGQIVEQDLEADPEQILPAPAQVAEEWPLVGQQLVETAIQGIALGNPLVFAEQIPKGTVAIPMPVPAPRAARIDQAIGHQGLEHVQPASTLPTRRQPGRPESIPIKLSPALQGQPAGAPLPRAMQRQLAQADLHDFAIELRSRAVVGEDRHLPRLAVVGEDLDRPRPGRLLAVVDLPQIKHLALHYPLVRRAPALHHAPVAMELAVLRAGLGAQEHDAIVSEIPMASTT